jgi:hypothetical protein
MTAIFCIVESSSIESSRIKFTAAYTECAEEKQQQEA